MGTIRNTVEPGNFRGASNLGHGYNRHLHCRVLRMNRPLLSSVVVLLLSVPVLCASARSGPGDSTPNLLPEPKEMTVRVGQYFRLGPKTKIMVQLGHQQEDRIAAETLAEEVADQSGLKLNIVGTKVSSKATEGAIMLVRLQDIRVRRFLAGK